MVELICCKALYAYACAYVFVVSRREDIPHAIRVAKEPKRIRSWLYQQRRSLNRVEDVAST